MKPISFKRHRFSAAELSVVEEWCAQETTDHHFPNGNYLFFDPTAELAFFPKVYNDDWLFLVASRLARPAIASTEPLYQAEPRGAAKLRYATFAVAERYPMVGALDRLK